jgi:hypothetical protein
VYICIFPLGVAIIVYGLGLRGGPSIAICTWCRRVILEHEWRSRLRFQLQNWAPSGSKSRITHGFEEILLLGFVGCRHATDDLQQTPSRGKAQAYLIHLKIIIPHLLSPLAPHCAFPSSPFPPPSHPLTRSHRSRCCRGASPSTGRTGSRRCLVTGHWLPRAPLHGVTSPHSLTPFPSLPPVPLPLSLRWGGGRLAKTELIQFVHM